MNTPVPPTPPSSAALQAILQAATNTGTVTQTTGGQPPLQVGDALLATVVARAAAGQFILQTEAGQLTLQTAANLLDGAIVSLQVQLGGARPQVLILPAPLQAAPGGQAAAAGTPPTPAAVTAALTEGSTAIATILRPATAGATAASVTGAGAAGTATASQGPVGAPGLAAAAITGTPSAAAAANSPASAAAASGVRAGPGTAISGGGANAAPAVPTASATSLPAGTTITVRILSVSPPNAPSATSSAAHGGGTVVTGTVTGTTATGQTIVESQLGEISLNARTALPRGTTLALQFSGAPQLPSAAGEGSLLLSQQWEALRTAMAALQAGDPAAARTLAQQVIPQPSGGLTTGMLFFLSAMLTGDLRRWMGEEAVRALQRNAPGALDRLRQDFGEMRRMATEPTGQEWRSYVIPLLVGGDLEQLKLFVRGGRDEEGDGKDGKDPGTRFVIEVEFSRLGPFQFDGLTRGKSIDLLVRTRETLPGTMRDDIRRIYTDTVSALGFSGTIDFHRTPTFELNPTREVHARQSGVMV